MSSVLTIIQITISVLLIAAVLLQARGGGLSPVFGGESGVYRTRRGAEKMIFRATIALAVLFFLVAVLNLTLR